MGSVISLRPDMRGHENFRSTEECSTTISGVVPVLILAGSPSLFLRLPVVSIWLILQQVVFELVQAKTITPKSV